ncbi:hypothetical protein CCR75_007039 [Bremia lactucae]|uniref:Ribosomal protein mS38 C-terminal domain-containing protein n=1 Tax=Bremia lactucae TaxID=4779 RepID=A0A976IKU8_BRELC|nr:hypothetical protein CCR75_007039 [Bremia lactucae]
MSGLRAAARCAFRASQRSLKLPQLTSYRSFTSTHAPDSMFQNSSNPMPEDLSLKYPRADPSLLWKVGSFPLRSELEVEEEGSLICSENLWDTSGMLSSLHDNLPLRDIINFNVDTLLRQMDGYLADSVVKKRRKKMNKHKHRKRKKALRMRTKKN